MNKYGLFIVISGLLLLAACKKEPSGAGPEWEAINKDVLDLLRKGEYDRGVELAKKALELAERNAGPEHPDVATSLNNLAMLYHTQGKYDQAEPLYKRSLAIRERALGPDHPDVAASLNNLAVLYDTQGKYERDCSRRAACSSLHL